MAQARIPSDRPPTPPGEMLLEEFIRPLGMTQAELADRIGVSYVRLNEIVNGRRGITPSTALRLARALSTSPQFWLNGQLALDLYRASHDEEELRQLERIERSHVETQARGPGGPVEDRGPRDWSQMWSHSPPSGTVHRRPRAAHPRRPRTVAASREHWSALLGSVLGATLSSPPPHGPPR